MGAVALDVGLLRRRRDFGLLVAGQFVSNAGSFLTVVALPFQVYALTHSSLAVGLLGLAEFVPIVGLGLLGGVLADAVDRRRVVQGAELAAALVALGLVVNALLDAPAPVGALRRRGANAACSRRCARRSTRSCRGWWSATSSRRRQPSSSPATTRRRSGARRWAGC